jgi:carotenoid cleavage dioxygenase-like enzyme
MSTAQRPEIGPSDAAAFARAAWRPTDREDSYEITDIRGEIPRELHGTLFRNGPSQKLLPAEGYQAMHLFDGDGLVHALRLDEGRAFYTGRFVRSESFLREQAEGRLCMNLLGVACADPVPDLFMRQQHNTNVIHHGGRLLAMVENAPPFSLDARTLESEGLWHLDGRMLGMSTSAHPKVDGRTGQMILHGYQPVEPFMQLYTVEADGNVSMADTVDVPYATMMHDIAITENYAIVLLTPVLLDAEVLLSGRSFADAISYQPDKGLKFGVRRRQLGAPVQWFEAPTPGYIFHPGNAYEEDGKIFMDAATYTDPQALLDTLATLRSGRVSKGFHAYPFLYELDLASGRCTERQLDERNCEFPRCDDRLVGYRNRYGYAALSRGTGGGLDDTWSTIVRYDRTGGPNVIHDFGAWQWPSEPVFVPRSVDAGEADGFVLTVVYDGVEDSSYLAILDAQAMDREPLAICPLQHRIPMGFHGNFAGGIV